MMAVIDCDWLPAQLADLDIVASCVIPGEPLSKARPRFATRTGHAYTPKATQNAEEIVGWHVKLAYRQEADPKSGFGVRVKFYVKNGQRKDIDNMTKLVFDALNNVVWSDDRQVKELMAWCYEDYGNPRTEVVVYRLGFAVERPTRPCTVCSTPFIVYRSQPNRKYCSASCAGNAARTGIWTKCAQCGAELYRPKAVSNRNGGKYFCNAQCQSAYGTVSLVCPQCAEPFTRPRSLIRAGQICCSQRCVALLRNAKSRSKPKGTCQRCGGGVSRREYTYCAVCSTEIRKGKRAYAA